MSKEIHSNAADMHRAVALLRAKVTGDKPTETIHIHDAISQDRLGNLVGPLLEVSSHFMQTMIRKGALDAASFHDWITALESGYLQAELDGPDGETND